MYYYILKKTDSGYVIKTKSDQAAAPRGYISIKGEKFQFAKVVIVDGLPTIAEDLEAKAAAEAAEASKPTKESLLAEVSAATNVEEIKEIVNKVINEVL